MKIVPGLGMCPIFQFEQAKNDNRQKKNPQCIGIRKPYKSKYSTHRYKKSVLKT